MGAIADTANDQQRQVLAAGAEAGKAGVDAFNAAQAQITAQQQSSVQRAHDISRVVGVTESQNASLDALAGTPFDRANASLAQSRAMFESGRASQDASNTAYFGKIRAIEPMIDALRAANQSGGGGGGGGSGSGSGSSGGIGDLTDAQLGKYLMNQASSQRAQAIATAQSQRDTLTAQRQLVGKQRQANRQVLRSKGRLGKVALRQPQKIERRLEHKQGRLSHIQQRVEAMEPGADRHALRQREQQVQQRVNRLGRIGEMARRQVELRGQSKDLTGKISAADTTYRNLLPTEGGTPLSQDALRIADELGVDPTLAQALVGPTTDAQYDRALTYQASQAQPNLYADAVYLKVRPSELEGLQNSRAWKTLDATVQGQLADGASREWFQQALQGSLSDKKNMKKLGITTAEAQVLVRLAVRRYANLFPTINEQQNLANAQAAQGG